MGKSELHYVVRTPDWKKRHVFHVDLMRPWYYETPSLSMFVEEVESREVEGDLMHPGRKKLQEKSPVIRHKLNKSQRQPFYSDAYFLWQVTLHNKLASYLADQTPEGGGGSGRNVSGRNAIE